MKYPELDKDIMPVSQFRSETAAYLKKIKKTKRPIILTQHGRSAAVVLDIGEFIKLSQGKNKKKLDDLCGSWKDDKSADEIVEQIYSARTSSGSKGSL